MKRREFVELGMTLGAASLAGTFWRCGCVAADMGGKYSDVS